MKWQGPKPVNWEEWEAIERAERELWNTPAAPNPGVLFPPRILYACQHCGEEFGEGEQDNGACPYCGCRGLDPVGECGG